MYYNAKDAVEFCQSSKLLETMKNIAVFSYEHGLLGDSAASADAVGIETPSGVFGDKGNIKLRFTDKYMQMAADGKL